MSVERRIPQLDWLVKLESIFGENNDIEIDGDRFSVIARRTSKFIKAENQWFVEFNNPNIFPVSREKYYLANDRGVVFYDFVNENNTLREAMFELVREIDQVALARDVVERVSQELQSAKVIIRDGGRRHNKLF